MAATDNFFRFLDEVLNVLVIDPDPSMEERCYGPLFLNLPCCRVHYASDNKEALRVLKSGKRFHVCITELGIDDVEHDSFFIINHYARLSSIMVVTGYPSAEAGAQAVRCGARSVIDKSIPFATDRFYTLFSKLVLINVINCRYNEWSGDSLNIATGILFEHKPVTVTEWAEQMKITDRQLRNLWHSGSGFGAKQMLFLHACIDAALQYHGLRISGSALSGSTAERFCRKQYASYFSAHRDILLYILS